MTGDWKGLQRFPATWNNQGFDAFTARTKKLSMSAKIIQRPKGQAPHYDLLEILTIAVGVLLIIALIVVF
jgi:hypothetical protein